MKITTLLLPALLMVSGAKAQADLKAQIKPTMDSLIQNIKSPGRIRIAVTPTRQSHNIVFITSYLTDMVTEILTNTTINGNRVLVTPPENLTDQSFQTTPYNQLAIKLGKEKDQQFLFATSITAFDKNYILKFQLYNAEGDMIGFLSKPMSYSEEIKLIGIASNPATVPPPVSQPISTAVIGTSSNIPAAPPAEELPRMPANCNRDEAGLLILTNMTKTRLVVELKRDTGPMSWSPEDRKFLNLSVGEKAVVVCREGGWSIDSYDKQPYAFDKPIASTSATVTRCNYTKKEIIL